MRNLIIFGTGIVADCISYVFESSQDSDYMIAGYCVDDSFFSRTSFRDKPIIPYSALVESYKPKDFSICVALGYHKINELRKEKFEIFKSLGYSFASYAPKKIREMMDIGENTVIFENVVVQPYAKVGDNCLVWGGALLGHHSSVDNHCWISGGASIGGGAKILEKSFVGLDATITENVTVGEHSLIGAKTLVSKCTEPESVVIESRTPVHRLSTSSFVKLSKSF